MDLIHPRRLQNLFLWLVGKLFRNHNGQISDVFLDLTPRTNAFGFGGGTLSDDVSSSSIGWWVSVAVVFFLSFSNFACIFFSGLQKMVEIPLAEVTCCAIY